MYFRAIILFLATAFLLQNSIAQTRTLDSLSRILAKKNLPDTVRIQASLDLAYEIRFAKTDSSLGIAKEMYALSTKINFIKGIATAKYIEGIWFSLKGKYHESLENYFNALETFGKINNEAGTAKVYNNIAIIYYYQKNYKKAEDFLKKSLVLNEKIKNFAEISRSLNNLGRIQLETNQYKSALAYFEKAIDIVNKNNISTEISTYHCNMAEVLMKLEQYEDALQNAKTAAIMSEKTGNMRIFARANIVTGAIYLQENNILEAQKILEKATPIARKLKFPEEHLLALEYSYKLYDKLQQYEKAYLFFKDYKVMNDSIINQTNYKIALQREFEYNEQQSKLQQENQEKQRKLERLSQEKQRKIEIWIRYLLIAGVLLALGTVFFALRAFRIKSKAFVIISQQKSAIELQQEELQVMNEELTQTQEEIISQRNFIEAQNQNLSNQNIQIKQSITTALAIQKALLPFDNRLHKILREYFVLYMPRDIVSGDFYWIEKVENKVIVVAADCTGHGVPGAFMSLVAINLLERIVLQQDITAPAQILRNLHDLVRVALKQEEIENQSGMDLGIAVIEENEDKTAEIVLKFAGAKRPFYYVNANKPDIMNKIAGTRKSIGGIQNETVHFEENTITLPTDSVFYMSSDGLADQNNVARKRLQDEPILQILLANYTHSLDTQHQKISALLETHMLGTEQRDDILLLGVKV